jgi:hypothetical protein
VCHPGKINAVEKTRISLTIAPDVLAAVDTEAQTAGLSRSAWVEKVSREAAIRAQFERFAPPGGVEEFPAEMADRVKGVLALWKRPEDGE